jgi:hypothetical protein
VLGTRHRGVDHAIHNYPYMRARDNRALANLIQTVALA